MNSVDVSPSSGFSHIYDSMNTSLSTTNPLVLLALTLIIIFYFIVFSYLGYTVNYPQQTESGGIRFIEIVMWGLIVFLVLINGIQYFFKIDVQTAVKNLFQGKPEVDIKIGPEKRFEEKGKNLAKEVEKDLGLGNLTSVGGEVFNVPGNEYTFDQAKALCKAYGSKLATYNQIEDAYKSGAEWCNYGWSSKQMALFPTQKTTWNKLQKVKGHKHDCGRPGVNGGFIDNENVKFGVNCFGLKPNITPEERQKMSDTPLYPLTQKEKDFNKRVEFWKEKLPDILVAPFNNNEWNMS